MVRARVLVVILLGLLLILTGSAYYLASTSTGTIAVQVRDAPAGWSHVTVAFSEVRVRSADAANSTGWLSLGLAETHVDFLALGNLTKLLALGRAPPGTYTQIRIVVSSVVGVPSSGPAVTMLVPDGILLTTTPFVLRGGGTTTVTIDLDLSRSIQQANGMWVFTPVLRQVAVT